MNKEGFSYWEKALYDQVYDLIVIGAGLTGQSVAHFFKKEHPKANVLILDRGHFPIGASTRNAGFVCFGTVGEHIDDLQIENEVRIKKRILDRYKGLKLLRNTLGDSEIEYEPTGGWEIFTNPAEFKKCTDQIDRVNNWMKDLTGNDDVYQAGTYQGYSAIFNPHEGMVHPGKMIRRLTQLNTDLGIQFRWNTPVKNIQIESGEIISQNGDVFKAERITVATNAFTSQLLPEKLISPGRGYVFVTKPINEVKWKGTFHFNKGYVYFRNLGEDRMLIGGGRNVDHETEETTEFGINERIKEYLIQFTNEIIRLEKNWEIEQEWSGIMGFTDTKSPILEKIGDKCIVVAGLSGMGVALAMQLGKRAAKSF